MSRDLDPTTERRQDHNRLALVHALDQVQHGIKRAQDWLLEVSRLPKDIGNLSHGDRAEIDEYGEMLKGMISNLADELEKVFPRE